MYERPSNLDDATVLDALRSHWSIDAAEATYAPVGFGSHHWLTENHFLTVDAAVDQELRRIAFSAAYQLRHDAGLEFVVAPILSNAGHVLEAFGDDWVMHVYDRLSIIDDTPYGSHDDPEVVNLVQRIHDGSGHVHEARTEDFSIADRSELEKALIDVDESWGTGPFAEPCRLAVRENEQLIRDGLRLHDEWVAVVPRGGWVITHGEPHRANVFRTSDGWAVVDWDTALIAPAERDWWDMHNSPGDPSLKALYEFRWSLLEVACYVALFTSDHADDANTRESWKNFEQYLGALAGQVQQRDQFLRRE